MKRKIVASNRIKSFYCPYCGNNTVFDTEKDVYRTMDVGYHDTCICDECGAELLSEPQYDGTVEFVPVNNEDWHEKYWR